MMPTWNFRLATQRNGQRDGELMLVSRDLRHWARAGLPGRHLQAALDDWARAAPQLEAAWQGLEVRHWQGCAAFDPALCLAPLPRAYQWVDASVYRHHAQLLYRWRGQPIPAGYEDQPLVYQGGSDQLLGPCEPIVAVDEAHDIDLEAEIGILTTDLPLGASAAQAEAGIALVVLLNDVSLRGLIPGELARGFGFYQSKPATSFAPVAVPPSALGQAWQGQLLQRPVQVSVNGQRLGSPHAGAGTVFHFGQILQHLARTRALGAGTVVGAGTISNEAPGAGHACLTEARMQQALDGVPAPAWRPYLRHGDRVRIEVLDEAGASVFGAIDQPVVVAGPQAR